MIFINRPTWSRTYSHALADGGLPEFPSPVDPAVFLPQPVDAVRIVGLVELRVRGAEAVGLVGVKGARGNRNAVGSQCVAD